ncbi:hypothetical protein HUA76_38350 [Myxococcus sp. CA056]|uniref:hypothetical protein n=1 Tax=unclassified Myxococcus TaxID=2648731 RepID=UPI00157B6380|nr:MULTISPECIES: hypothetical protein [unclassified Myxococcus]NTX16650.1 hypothetical protein [Myxococcus sp. CA056]NTX54375.1 hypothetical protein [Myxococcus sp. CA039A]
MEFWRVVLAPIYAAFLAALVVAAFTFGRRGARARIPRLPLVWFGMLALGALALVLRLGEGGGPTLLSDEAVGKSLALALLVVAALLAVRGTRVRSGADLLRGTVPQSLDEAVATLRSGEAPRWGVYQGTLDAEEVLTSPGGVPCAFFEAELREVAADGRKGALLSRERAYSPALTLRGAQVRAHVRFSPASLMAPMRPRRCRTLSVTPPSSWYEEVPVSPEGRGLSGASEADDEARALSWERVGSAGDTCFVVGELRRGAREGTYELRGRRGGAAMVVLGSDADVTRGTLARLAWRHFAAAGAMSMAAAFMLSRSM